MAKLLKLRRGTTTQHASFTGAEGELTVDITKDTAVVHDGSQAGGRPLAREDMSNVSSASIAGRLGTDSIAVAKISAGTLPSDVKIADANISGNLTIESADIVDGTIVSGDIADGTIVNGDIAANAAIAGTKLENSGVTAGSYGSSSAIPIVTVDAQGLVTAASTTAIDSTTIANGSASVAVSNNGPITSNAKHDFSAGIDVTGLTTTENLLIEKSSGNVNATIKSNDAYGTLEIGGQTGCFIDLKTPASDDYDIRFVSDGYIYAKSDINLSPTTGNVVNVNKNLNCAEGLDVTGNITCTGTVDGVDVAALKTSKDSLSTTNGVILNTVTASSTHPQSENSNKLSTTAYVRTAITEAKPFPSGTLMLFAQSSAPTGWTKSTTHNNKALRVVSGSASSGGSNAFTTAFGSARGISANAANTTAAGNVSSSAGNTTATGNVSVSVANSTQGGNVSIGDTTAGGNVSISSVSTSGSVSSHTLSTNEMPSHSHTVLTAASRNQWRNSGQGFQTSWLNFYNTGRSQGSGNTESQGGNGGHSHGFSGSSHNHNGSLSGTAHNHNASFSGSAHNHNATGSFTGTAHNHNVSSSFSGTAHNHSISVGNLDMAVQYVDVIIATKD